MGNCSLNARVEFHGGAPCGDSSAFELIDQHAPNAFGSFGFGGHEVIDIELAVRRGAPEDSPSSDPDAVTVVVGGEKAKALPITLFVDVHQFLWGQAGSKLSKDRKHVGQQPLVIWVNVIEAHARKACR